MKSKNRIVASMIGVIGICAAVGWKTKHPSQGSDKWLISLPDEKWDIVRDELVKIRNSVDKPIEERIQMAKYIDYIDKMRRRLMYEGISNYKFPVHGEHGTNLYKKD